MEDKPLPEPIVDSLTKLISELTETINDRATSRPGELVPPGPLPETPLYEAVQAVERHYPTTKLPVEAWDIWVEMLNLAEIRESDDAADSHYRRFYKLCNSLRKWTRRELTRIKKKSTASRTFNPSEIANELGISTETVNHYAKKARVPTPGVGQREHRYSTRDAKLICAEIGNSTAALETKANAAKLLAELEES